MRSSDVPVRIARQRSPVSIVAVKLTEDLSASAPSEAAGLLRRWDAAGERWIDTSQTIAIVDSQGIFVGALSGQTGLAVPRSGDGRTVYDLIQLGCS